jgi:RimJ/RimL family protein N-acetyltransferase
MAHRFPHVVKTERLLLRPWTVADAPLLKRAIDENLEHLQAWMPWAMDEPSTLDVIEARIEKFAADFAAGTDGVYAIFMRDESVALGGTGLHTRCADGLEIGYWIHHEYRRRGYATEAAAALTAAAFGLASVQQVQIRCDLQNLVSAAVPARLGFRHIETLVADTVTPLGRPLRRRPTGAPDPWRLARGHLHKSHRYVGRRAARADSTAHRRLQGTVPDGATKRGRNMTTLVADSRG